MAVVCWSGWWRSGADGWHGTATGCSVICCTHVGRGLGEVTIQPPHPPSGRACVITDNKPRRCDCGEKYGRLLTSLWHVMTGVRDGQGRYKWLAFTTVPPRPSPRLTVTRDEGGRDGQGTYKRLRLTWLWGGVSIVIIRRQNSYTMYTCVEIDGSGLFGGRDGNTML